jgi:two-component system cell cycle sensor histidine kinase/response regulator CckA
MTHLQTLDAANHGTVLVVEDDSIQRRLICELLTHEGLPIAEAASAEAAVRVVRERDISVVVLDLHLPDGSGSELMERIVRADPRVRVIINTGHADLETAKDAVNFGAFAYFEKGSDPSELILAAHRGVRDHTAERLAAAERKLESIIRHAPDLILELDETGTVLAANHAPPSAPSGTPEDGIGLSLKAYLPNCTACGGVPSRVIARCLTEHKAIDFECEGPMNGEEPRVLACRVGPIDDGEGERPRAVLIARDITESRAAERRLREREEQLRHSQKMEAVGQLAGGVAHDFNNLIMAIHAYADLAASALSPGQEAGEHLARVREAAAQAAGITQALLTYTRRRSADKTPVELAAIVTRTTALLQRTIPANIELRVEPEGDDPVRVIGDETQLQQVVMNLAINARDAMPTGGVLTISTGIDPEDERFARLVVTDTGVGMTEAVRARVFEPYFTTKTREQGTGLGLAIIHGIVEELGGSVSVQSEPGHGSTFIVRLHRTGNEPTSQPSRSAKRIVRGEGIAVLAEDNEHVRRVVTLMLSSMGYLVEQFSNGAEALARLQDTTKDAPTLALLDVDLPGKNGLEIAAIVAHNGSYPVVMMTGGSSGTDADELDRSEIAIALRKPFMRADLATALAKAREALVADQRAGAGARPS